MTAHIRPASLSKSATSPLEKVLAIPVSGPGKRQREAELP